MSAVAELLKGTVSESLAKLTQPSGLVPAAIFVLLNLAFVYPSAKAEDVGIALQFFQLSGAWQVVVIATTVSVFGYLLTNFASTTVETLAGGSWKGSVLHELLVYRQAVKRDRLVKQLNERRPEDNHAELAWLLSSRYPSSASGPSRPAPTRFGNVLLAAQSMIFRRYGFEISSLWSQLESAPSVKSAPAIAAAKDEKTTLDLLANLVLVAVGFTLEAVAYFAVHDHWRSVLYALLPIPAAYITYRIAVTKARAWGDSMETAVDLHRADLQKDLKLRNTAGAADEHLMWERASRFFLAEAPAGDAEALFDAASSPAPHVSVGAGTTAALVESAIVDTCTRVDSDWTLQLVRYVVLVSRDPAAVADAKTVVIVSDPRFTAFPADPSPEGRSGAIGRRVENHPSIIWTIDDLSPGESVAIVYTCPIWWIHVDEAAAVADERPIGIRIAVPTEGSVEVRTILAGHGVPTLEVAGAPKEPQAAGDATTWSLSPTDGTAWLVLPGSAE